MSFGKRDYLLWLESLLVFLILNGTTKRKLEILAFLCCGEIVKNPIVERVINLISRRKSVYLIQNR